MIFRSIEGVKERFRGASPIRLAELLDSNEKRPDFIGEISLSLKSGIVTSIS